MRDIRNPNNYENEDTRPSVIKHMFVFAFLTALTIGGVWFFNRNGGEARILLEKLATQLVMPVGLIWYALLFVSYFAFASRMRALAFIAFLTCAILTIAGNEMVASRFAETLESPFLDARPLEDEKYDTLIVLGGGASFPSTENEQLGSSGDRIALAAEMYHAGKVDRIICTGSNIGSMMTAGEPSTAEVGKTLLERLGVPGKVIEFVPGRNTREEMVSLAEEFGTSTEAANDDESDDKAESDEQEDTESEDTQQTKRIGLITSAWHLPRALRLAENAGLPVQPVPADFKTDHKPFNVRSVIPTAGSLDKTTAIAKEYLARLAGQ